MKPSLWRDLRGYWSVCDSPALLNVVGHIFQRPEKTWVIEEEDDPKRMFIFQMEAAYAVLKREMPAGEQYCEYELKRRDETAFVVTYPEVLDSIRADGWSVVSRSW